MSWSWISVVAWAALLYVLNLLFDYWRTLRSIRYCPGIRQFLAVHSVLANLPAEPIRWVTRGSYYAWKMKYRDFMRYDSDVYSGVNIFPKPRIWIDIADPAIIKDITTTSRARFPKPLDTYAMLAFFGDNLVVTEGEVYKTHRKVANPAFSEPNMKFVWQESVRIMLDLLDNVWKNESEIAVDNGAEVTTRITLLIIGSAGFGRRIAWTDDFILPEGHKLTFTDALHTVLADLGIRLVVPEWAMGLSEKLRHVRLAFQELRQHMAEMVDARRKSEKKDDHHDLFHNLLDAADEEENSLTDDEVFGNMFIFLLAGHETTAHTLAYAFGLLALYPDEQERVYQYICKVLPNGRVPVHEDMAALAPVMNVFYETLRMQPPVNGIPKTCTEDTTFATTNWKGERRTVFVPKGSYINLNVAGLHNHPRYWKDPEVFRPSRFSEPDWPRDAFLPFSGGQRSCIGRRFAENESIVILTMLLQRYRVEPKVDPQYAHETFEERKARMMHGKEGVTLTPTSMPLVFKRRS